MNNNEKIPNQNYLNNKGSFPMNNRNIKSNITNTYNIPLKNSIELKSDENSVIKYYLYPKIDFTKEESKYSKVLLVIGQTGHGKTTFINALVNIYLGITINDNFRYLLVQNENKEQLDSITKEITLYKIRPKKGLNFPPLIIIDTPGFGDTSGEKGDKLNLQKFKEFFESKKIKNINCVLYIIIGAGSRFGENDKKIINNLLNLFSINLKENFVVGATNFIPGSKKDIPNIIKSLSNEKHFYYQNVLKKNNYSKEQIIQSYWYFASDNKIISDNEIELNEREKEKWQYTENQIKYFIENKLKNLDKKNIEDSKNVLNIRFQLENEIKSFAEKIDVLISKKIACEFNLNEQKNYKEFIGILIDKIKNNNIKKENIEKTLKEIDNAIPYMKKIMSSPFKTDNQNLVCENCHSNCHRNCNCSFSGISEWFCHMINFFGKCKICNHSLSEHKKGNFIYKQNEENERLLNNEIEEIKNYIQSLSEIKTKDIQDINEINWTNDFFQESINNCEKQMKNCDKEIKKAEKQNLLIENEVIEYLKKIKTNFIFLRENALNKEDRTIKSFIEEYSKNKSDKEKEIIEELYKKYIYKSEP